LHDLWIFDPDTDTWKPGRPYAGDLYDFVAVGFGNQLYVMTSGSAGASGSKGTGVTGAAAGEMAVYNAATDTWSTLGVGVTPPARLGAGSASSASKAWIFGGEDAQTYTPLSDAWEFDFATKRWTQIEDLPMPLIQPAGAAVGNSLVVFGGMDENFQPSGRTFAYEVGAESPVVELPGGKGANRVVVSLKGENVQVVNNNKRPPLFNAPLGSFAKLTILGAAEIGHGDDRSRAQRRGVNRGRDRVRRPRRQEGR